MCGTLRRAVRRKARLESQLELYIIMAVPTAMYGSDTWVMRTKHEIRI